MTKRREEIRTRLATGTIVQSRLSWHGFLGNVAAVIYSCVTRVHSHHLAQTSAPFPDFNPLSLILRIKVVFTVLASVG